LTLASERRLSKTTLPLAMKVRTLVKPICMHMDWRSCMGSLPVPPTLTALRRATYAFMSPLDAYSMEKRCFRVGQWVRLCGLAEAPAVGQVMEAEVEGVGVCLANVDGELSALDNVCPHRQGPLGQGWLEGEAVVCPWHSWAFHAKTGVAEYPENERVEVFPVLIEGEDVLVDIE
jgi:nitrite reductase (NADH) small subunit